MAIGDISSDSQIQFVLFEHLPVASQRLRFDHRALSSRGQSRWYVYPVRASDAIGEKSLLTRFKVSY
jgi:hypothetical protein